MKKTSGFTLIELILVIAILAVISTLAIQKLSGVKDDAKEKINVANLVRISNALETHMATNPGKVRFDKLDALTMYGTASGTDGSTAKLKDTAALMIYASSPSNQTNKGLSPELWNAPCHQYAPDRDAHVLGTYYLTAAEAQALHDDLGMSYVMRGTTEGAHFGAGDDHAWISDDVTNPLKCSSISTAITNGLAVAIVNPGSTKSDNNPVGPTIYKACGENVFFALSGRSVSLSVGGAPCGNNAEAFDALHNGEGILLAFGIGDCASIVGCNLSGLDTAPICPVVESDVYGRYIVLVRLVKRSGTVHAEFAGVMDSKGRTASMLR